ncbi:NAD(P)H-binding protein [Streptomyces sp. NPDC002845]
MLLITGASGTVGAETARLVAAQGEAVRLLSRAPSRLVPPAGPVEVAHGDYADPASLRSALCGVRAALLITNDPTRPELDRNLAEAAREAGVQHVVKLSTLSVTDPLPHGLITRWHSAGEAFIRSSGLEWTFLRPRAFMSNTLAWASGIKAEGVVRAYPADTPVACVDPRDIAAVAAAALTRPGHRGTSYALTGPQALTARQQVGIIADVLGRPLLFQARSAAQARRELEKRYPAAAVQALLDSATLRPGNDKSRTEKAVEQVVQRPARSFADWVRDHADCFQAGPGQL